MELASQQLVTAAWILVGLYAAVILFFVIRGAKKITNIDDYALGSVLFSPYAVGLSLAASITSAATFIINPGFVALFGISGVLSMAIALPFAALISLVVLTKGFRRHGTTVKALTMAQWMQTMYKSRGYGIFFGFLSLLLITFVVLICVGLTKVLSASLNIPELYTLIGIVTFVFGYMMFGGANSMVYTNTIQAILMLIVAFVLLGSGYQHFSEGVHGFLEKLEAIDPLLVSTTNESSFLFRDFFEIFVAQFIVGIAIICQPHILTKSLLLKSDADVNKYLAVGITAQLLFFFVVFTGLYIRLTFPDLTAGGTPIPMDGLVSAYVVSEFPVFVGLLVVMGLISAGLSTLEGLIQSLSTTITKDIIDPLFGKQLKLSENTGRAVFINKLVIVVLAVVAVFVSYDQLVNPKLSVGIFAQNGVYAYFSAAFVPILMGMFLKNVPLAAPVAASVTAVVVHFTIYYGQIAIPFTKATGENPGVAAAVAIVCSVLAGAVVYLWHQRKAVR
ncbi:sodium/pantothenate symporter [Cyclonatronum proteinivorum]|uniref:Sodium/pantothenate symporter n=1 Tax=Cyclonatronum proteinivorum TaxID=1457365 RepID=A0A345UHR3_9BACT|nr:sodium:solute symporter [Cyclonatronum proteinivorum]AXJ00015.1 sodium/pantothenate symporter [Cyclonatronum proteinivorum]